MKLLIRAAMVFFATLLAAALFALVAPVLVELVTRSESPPVLAALQALAFAAEASTARPGG